MQGYAGIVQERWFHSINTENVLSLKGEQREENQTMDSAQAAKFIRETISESLEQDRADVEITDDMPLIGGDGALDSMRLIELCLELEDKASDAGFEFDWTSDTAMSRSRSMFRSIQSLAEEFVTQYKVQQ